MKKLSIIILSYNVKQLLLDCLQSLPQKQGWEVVVVDNASSDGSVPAVQARFPQIKVILNSHNLGFAAGNNVALQTSQGEYVLLLNPDTVVYPNTIETVLKFMETHSAYGASTCRVELPDGSLDYSSHRGFPNPWNSFLHLFTRLPSSYALPASGLKTIHDIDALTGAFAMIRRTAGDQVGWLDEDYYWNGEDLDFCYKLHQKGWKIAFIPQVKITHFKGSSSGLYKTGQGQSTVEARVRSVKSGIAAMKIFYCKHYAPQYPAPLNWLVYLGISVLQVIRLLKVTLFNQSI